MLSESVIHLFVHKADIQPFHLGANNSILSVAVKQILGMFTILSTWLQKIDDLIYFLMKILTYSSQVF